MKTCNKDLDQDAAYLAALNEAMEKWGGYSVMNDGDIVEAKIGSYYQCPVCVYRHVYSDSKCLNLSPRCFLNDMDNMGNRFCSKEFWRVVFAQKAKDYPHSASILTKCTNVSAPNVTV